MPPPPMRERPQTYAARFAAMKNIPPFLRMVWEASPALALSMGGLRLIRALLPVTMLYVGKLIIDEVVRLSGGAAGESLGALWQSGALHAVTILVLIELGLAIFSDILGRLVRLTDLLLQERLVISLSTRLMRHAAELDLEDFEDAVLQDKLERARRQAAGRMSLLGLLFGQMQDALTVATFAGGLLLYNPWLVVLLLIALIPAFLGESHFKSLSYQLNYRRTPQMRERDYLRMIASSADSAKEVKMFGLSDFLRERYLDLARRFYRENLGIARRETVWLSVLTGLGTLGYYGAYLWIIARTITGDLSLGDLTFLAGSFQRLRALLESLLIRFSDVAAQAMYLEDLFDFLRVEPEIFSKQGALDVPDPISEGFEFQNVGFYYPGSNRYAVRGLSFRLRAGETVALVGENGAGKTTLVKLLARLYDPDEGRILLDGRDLRDYDLDQLRAAIGAIFQDFMRYNMTAADNIAVGRIEARADRGRIENAAQQALADTIIAKLPAGYDQMIGKRFANGVELSGGEWQRVAIARGYMREAQVLILDEPTAALDARSEYEVFKRFKELSAARTAVLISHRFSSVRMADRILVLADGSVEAEGTHEELMEEEGRYRDLFELQAAGYR
ncbi:MAG: ABC transporter ATP-binding protein [Paracoccus sp. (in: a-proteobacteria)]|nr:ABC transporter ATP-binding protein [Paracoccus sp. (in: a-proteobacteria)]